MSSLRIIVVALAAVLAGLTSARADSGTVRISFIKAGWVIGGSVGSGTPPSAAALIRRPSGGWATASPRAGRRPTRSVAPAHLPPVGHRGRHGAAGSIFTVMRRRRSSTNQKGAV